MLFSTGDVAEIIGVSPSTIKNWCDDFKPYISDNARPAKGGHRTFTVDDLKVFTLVKRAKSLDEAFVALSNGERGELPSAYGDLSLTVDSHDKVILLESRVQQLMAQLEELKPYRDQNIALTALLKKAEEDLEKSRAEVLALHLRIARLDPKG